MTQDKRKKNPKNKKNSKRVKTILVVVEKSAQLEPQQTSNGSDLPAESPSQNREPTNQDIRPLDEELLRKILNVQHKKSKEDLANYIIGGLSQYHLEQSLDLETCFHSVIHCYPVAQLQAPAPIVPAVPAAPATPPTDIDITNAYKYTAQLGLANGCWNQDVKRAFHYIGKLHADCNYVRTGQLAGIIAGVLPGALAAALPGALVDIKAMISNTGRANCNRVNFTEYSAQGFHRVNLPLTPLLKVNAAPGMGYPGGPAVAVPAALAVGASSANFPTTISAWEAMTAANLMTLSIEYNDTFGIVAGDSVQDMKAKFKQWMCGSFY